MKPRAHLPRWQVQLMIEHPDDPVRVFSIRGFSASDYVTGPPEPPRAAQTLRANPPSAMPLVILPLPTNADPPLSAKERNFCRGIKFGLNCAHLLRLWRRW